jgi:hypothetical protein
MKILTCLLLLSAAAFASDAEEPIPLGDPKRCLRVLAGLSCEKPGPVQFVGRIEDGRFAFVRVLPPMESPGRKRVAACIMGHPAYFVPRFAQSKPNEDGNHVYTVNAWSEMCPD